MRFPYLFSISIFFALSTICSKGLAQQFHSQFSSALAASHKTDKPVIAIFSAQRCAPCKNMLKNVYPSNQVSLFHEQFVWAYLDIDQMVNRHIMEEFKATTVPYIAFIGTDGLPIAQVAGSKTAHEFATILSVVLAQHKKTKEIGGIATAQTEKSLARSPKVSKPTKKIFGGLLIKKNNDAN